MATPVFRISIPETELRVIDIVEDLSEVRWLVPPRPGRKLSLECYISPVPSAEAPVDRPDFVAALELGRDRSFVVLLSDLEVSDRDREQLRDVREESVRSALASGITIRSEYRAVAFFIDDNGVRGMIEYIPVAV